MLWICLLLAHVFIAFFTILLMTVYEIYQVRYHNRRINVMDIFVNYTLTFIPVLNIGLMFAFCSLLVGILIRKCKINEALEDLIRKKSKSSEKEVDTTESR